MPRVVFHQTFLSCWVRIGIALVIMAGLFNLGIPAQVTARPTVAPLVELRLRSESQLKTEAGWYDSAIREISRISSLDLTKSEDIKTARAILDKHVPNLRYNRSKLATIGLADSTFVNAVRARAQDKTSAEQFAVELVKDQQAVFRISGGQSLGDRMRRSVTEDLEKLRRVAAQLKKASEDIKARTKNNHSGTIRSSAIKEFETTFSPVALPELSGDQIALIVVAVAVITLPPVGFGLLLLANAVVGQIIVVGGIAVTAELINTAVILTSRLISNLGTEEGQDKVAACQRDADNQYRRCMNAAADLGIFRVPGELACYADWLLASASCVIAR